jgi:hypothetical protein
MAISIERPTVGASTDTWGTTLNTGLLALQSTLNGTGTGKVTIEPDLTEGSWAINGTAVASTAAELNKLSTASVTTAELDLLNTAVSNTVVNSKAVIYGSAGEIASGALTSTSSVTGTSFEIGDWKIYVSDTDLKFQYSSVDVFKLSTTGEVTAEGDITAFGSA